MKKSDKNADKKKKIWRTPKDKVYYSNSEEITLKGDLELRGTLVIGYQDNSDDMKIAREVLGTQPVRHHHSEKRSKRNPNLIEKIILLAFDRIKKRNMGVPDCVAQSVWDEIQDLYNSLDYEWPEPELVGCITSMDVEHIIYCPKPTKPQRTKEIRRSNFDKKLSRLRKRFP